MTVSQGVKLWEEVRTKPMDDLIEFAGSASTMGAEYYPMANSRCSDEDLRIVREQIVSEAAIYGYPSGGKARQKVEFDKTASAIIHKTMGILPADAATNEVWIFINLRLLPDVLMWRYGSWMSQEGQWTLALERLFKLTRSMSGRLWWRAELLGYNAATRLGEDEAVQIMERPRIAGYRPLASSIAERHISSSVTSQRMELLRHVMKRLTRRLAVINIFIMTPTQIHAFVDDAFVESEKCLAAVSGEP